MKVVWIKSSLNFKSKWRNGRLILFKRIFDIFKNIGCYIMWNIFEVVLLIFSKFIGNYFCYMKGFIFYEYSYVKNILSEIFGNVY